VRPVTKPEKIAAEDLLDQAAALGIPWRRILEDEIRAERTLRLSLADVSEDWPIWPAFWILPLSLFDSWRVRDRIQVLAWKASRERCEASARQLRALHAHLLGRENGRATDATLMAKHLWFGYQRVLALMRIIRAAERVRGDTAEPIEWIRKKADCAKEDAQWALTRRNSPGRGHRLDDAMRRARNEGFEIPADGNEIRAFRRLRSCVKSTLKVQSRTPDVGLGLSGS
jgi:hypothetical protein